jgi:hypothetical protein
MNLGRFMDGSRWILLVVVLLTGLGSAVLTFLAVREQHTPAPLLPDGLVAVESPLDLGNIPQGVSDGVFNLVNQGEKSVKIAHILMSCRCTEYGISSMEIAPGETVQLSFKWDTTGIRNLGGASFAVYYAEGDQAGLRSLVLYVKGNVLPKFDFVPEKLEFTEGKLETKTVTLVPREENSDIMVTAVSDALAAFRVEKLDNRRFAVTFLPEDWVDKPGQIPYIVVETNYERERQCRVLIYVQ